MWVAKPPQRWREPQEKAMRTSRGARPVISDRHSKVVDLPLGLPLHLERRLRLWQSVPFKRVKWVKRPDHLSTMFQLVFGKGSKAPVNSQVSERGRGGIIAFAHLNLVPQKHLCLGGFQGKLSVWLRMSKSLLAGGGRLGGGALAPIRPPRHLLVELQRSQRTQEKKPVVGANWLASAKNEHTSYQYLTHLESTKHS